jgi:hypothetical protein
MSVAETVKQAPFDPNVIDFAGVELSTPYLGALMTGLYELDAGVYPFLSPALRDRFKPHRYYTDVYTNEQRVWRNPQRDQMMYALPRLAGAAGRLTTSLDGGARPDFTPEEVTPVKEGLLSLITAGSTRAALAEASNEDLASILNFTAETVLPFAERLDVFDKLVGTKIGPHLETARPFMDALAAGEKQGVREEFRDGIKGVLNLVQHTAQERAADRERLSATQAGGKAKDKLEARLQAEPGRFVTREDVAAGIGKAIEAVLADGATAPMLHELAQSILTGAGQTKGKDLNINIKALEVASEIVVRSLLSALPAAEQEPYRQLYKAASSNSAINFWAKTAIHGSGLVPDVLKRKLIRDRLDAPEKLVRLLASNGRHMYITLNQQLPATLRAMSGVLPATDKKTVISVYEKLRARFGAERVGSAAVKKVVAVA